jgi:hypothetical protein
MAKARKKNIKSRQAAAQPRAKGGRFVKKSKKKG